MIWHKEKEPPEFEGCLLTVCRAPIINKRDFELYPKLAAWDGECWVDIDGNIIDCHIISWAKAPKPRRK